MNETTIAPRIATGIGALLDRWPELRGANEESPVFVFAAGWRSGSTLLQRLLMPRVFVWGEPYGHAGLIDSLASPLRAFNAQWPAAGCFYDASGAPTGTSKELTERFIANLYPEVRALKSAHLSFLENLFGEPARRAGFARWGLKEVRLSADHAAWLRWLYPRAKFLFLVRDPWDAYRSYAAWAREGGVWHLRWPGEPLTPAVFGRHWRELATSFRDGAVRLGAFLVAYERLAAGEFADIEDYLGFHLYRAAAQVRPHDGGPPPLDALNEVESEALTAELGCVPEQFGYSPPGASSVLANAPVDRSRCAVLVPSLQSIEPRCEEALKQLEARGYVVRRLRGCSQIDLARAYLACDALADGCDETLWIDGDIEFEPDDVERLRRHGLPLVCGVYPKKGVRELSCHLLPETRTVVFGEGGGLLEIRYAATGFLLVRRQVYLDMRLQLGLPDCNQRGGRAIVPFFQPLVLPIGGGHWYLSEDYSFCERARRCGYQIWADTSIRLGHIGKHTFSWEEAGADTPRYTTYHFDVHQ